MQHCELWLVCNKIQSSEDQNANGNVDSKGQAHAVLVIGNCATNQVA